MPADSAFPPLPADIAARAQHIRANSHSTQALRQKTVDTRLGTDEISIPEARVLDAICRGLTNEQRADGCCAGPGCRKKLVRTMAARKYAGAMLDMDPFCSAVCARRFHGVAIRGDVKEEAA